MSQLITPSQASHWYAWSPSGWSPCHEVPRKDGKGMKQVTLREAREMNLVPSVTNVMGIISKPGLETWKQTQCIEAALTLPRLVAEPLDAFAQRVVADAEARSEAARSFGTAIHDAIEADLRTWTTRVSLPPWRDDLEPFCKPIQDWLAENVQAVHQLETIVGDRALGYAGRLDLDCDLRGVGHCLVDFKTQGVKNGKPVFYPEWSVQLSAYAHAAYEEPLPIVSVVIDSGKPTEPVLKVWPATGEDFETFELILALWRRLKDYYPKP